MTPQSRLPAWPMPTDESQRICDLLSLDILDTPQEPFFDGVVEIAAALGDVPIAAISLVDRERQWFKASTGLDVCQTGRGSSFCAHAIMNIETLVVEDAQLNPTFKDNPLVTGKYGIRFYAGVPLVTYSHRQIGALCIMDTRPRVIAPHTLRLLERLASMTVQVIETRRLTARLRRVFSDDDTNHLDDH